MPKLKLLLSTSSVTSSGVRPSSFWFCASLPAKASCVSTTPLGSPVEPDVKITKAAPRSISLRSALAEGAWSALSSAPDP